MLLLLETELAMLLLDVELALLLAELATLLLDAELALLLAELATLLLDEELALLLVLATLLVELLEDGLVLDVVAWLFLTWSYKSLIRAASSTELELEALDISALGLLELAIATD
jgi:hypothetical protein